MKDHIANCRSASVWAILPAGIRKYCEVGVWDAVVAAEIIDEVRSAIRVEFDSIVRTASEIANEPDEGAEIDFTWTDTSFCKFADGKDDI